MLQKYMHSNALISNFYFDDFLINLSKTSASKLDTILFTTL